MIPEVTIESLLKDLMELNERLYNCLDRAKGNEVLEWEIEDAKEALFYIIIDVQSAKEIK